MPGQLATVSTWSWAGVFARALLSGSIASCDSCDHRGNKGKDISSRDRRIPEAGDPDVGLAGMFIYRKLMMRRIGDRQETMGQEKMTWDGIERCLL